MQAISPILGVLLGAAILTACGDDGGDSNGPGEVELGSGTIEFESLSADQDLVLISGTQGGYHFIANARIRGLQMGDPDQFGQEDNPITRFAIFDEDGRQIDAMAPPYRLGYRLGADNWGHVLSTCGPNPSVVVRRSNEGVESSPNSKHGALA